MKHLKKRDKFLNERFEIEVINEAGIQSNNAKWSETMIGKLFGFAFKVLTLNGYLVDKFKDALGAKSFIIKNLAKRLEKAIDKLPGEYVQRNEDIDSKNIEMQFNDEVLKIMDVLNNSKNTPIGKIQEKIENSRLYLNNLINELDLKNDKHASIIKDIESKIVKLDTLINKISRITDQLSDVDIDTKTGYDISNVSKILGERSVIKRKNDLLKSELTNTISSAKEDVKLSTKSMFEIISILNKARGIYMEDVDGETIFKGNKKETVFSPNRRLFDLWEEKVLKILGRKSSIIPKKLLSYINNSLASVDPVKYNFEISPGVERNILDQLSDIDTAMAKVETKFTKSKIPHDVIPNGKSKSDTFYLKKHDRIIITQSSWLRNILAFKADVGNTFTYDEKRTDTEQHSIDDKTIFFIPSRTYVNGNVLGILSFSPDVLNGIKTNSGNKFDVKDLDLSGDEFWRKDPHYYWAVLDKKDFTTGDNIVFKILNPGISFTNDRLAKLHDNSLFESVVINRLDSIRGTYGDDDKIVEVDKTYLAKKFNFNSSSYRSIDNYFNSNK